MRLTFEQSEGVLCFKPCRFDGTLEDSKHPFLGTPIKVPHNGALTRAEQRAVDTLIAAVRTSAENVVRVADGGVAEVALDPSSLVLKPQGRPTMGLATLVFDALVAGNWCIVADHALVVSDASNARDRPRPHPEVPKPFYLLYPNEVVVIESASEMANALGWVS